MALCQNFTSWKTRILPSGAPASVVHSVQARVLVVVTPGTFKIYSRARLHCRHRAKIFREGTEEYMSFKRPLGDSCEHLQIGTTDAQWDEIAQSSATPWDPMDYRVHGILQARILEWVAFPFSKGFSQPRDKTQVSRIAGGFFTSWVTREAHRYTVTGGLKQVSR